MRVALPTNAVPNWLALLTGLTPDLVGVLGRAGLTANIWKQWSEKRGHGIVSHDCGVFWMLPMNSMC